MQDWWKENGPPVYMSVAGYLGLIKKPSGRQTAPAETGDLNDLVRMFSGTGGVIQ